jgi:hypothetical protein
MPRHFDPKIACLSIFLIGATVSPRPAHAGLSDWMRRCLLPFRVAAGRAVTTADRYETRQKEMTQYRKKMQEKWSAITIEEHAKIPTEKGDSANFNFGGVGGLWGTGHVVADLEPYRELFDAAAKAENKMQELGLILFHLSDGRVVASAVVAGREREIDASAVLRAANEKANELTGRGVKVHEIEFVHNHPFPLNYEVTIPKGSVNKETGEVEATGQRYFVGSSAPSYGDYSAVHFGNQDLMFESVLRNRGLYEEGKTILSMSIANVQENQVVKFRGVHKIESMNERITID